MKQLEFPFMAEIREQEYIEKLNRRIHIGVWASLILFIIFIVFLLITVVQVNNQIKELDHGKTQTTIPTRRD